MATVNWSGMRRQVELDLVVDTRDQARRIELPTLVIGCEHDQMVPLAHTRQLAVLIPAARYAQMRCGHIALMENPDEFVSLVLDFLGAPSEGVG